MKKYYRSRIMFSAMLSFLIILAIAVAGIWLVSYQRIEKNTDSFIESRLEAREEEERPRFSQEEVPAMFGYRPGRRNSPSVFYEFTLTADGNAEPVLRRGIPEDIEEDVKGYAADALKMNTDKGKIGSYKFGVRKNEDGTGRLILVDNYIQLHTLYGILKIAGLIGAGIFVLLIIVLYPVSGWMADIFVRNGEEQRRFITDAGHDLKTPVAIARANLDVLELREGQSKWSGNIRSQVDRMEHLVQDLIMMARLDEEKNEEALEEIELTALAEEIWQEYQPSMKQKNLRGETGLKETAAVRGSPSLIRRMVCLLMDNAVQYTPEEGTVRLSVEPDKKKVRVVLENTVTRLPSEKPEKLTERFVRGDSARTQKSGGSGIGLAAARRIAEKHRGRLAIDYPDEKTFRATVEI